VHLRISQLNFVQIFLCGVVDKSHHRRLLVHNDKPSTDSENNLDVQKFVFVEPLVPWFDGQSYYYLRDF
jgi:hypothetical protein